MHAAVELQVTIPADRRLQLPDDLPEGRAEIIVLYVDAPAAGEPARKAAVRRDPAATDSSAAKAARMTRPEPVDYFSRLTSRQPLALSAEVSRGLDEADRGER